MVGEEERGVPLVPSRPVWAKGLSALSRLLSHRRSQAVDVTQKIHGIRDSLAAPGPVPTSLIEQGDCASDLL